MLTKEKIERINELAKKKKQGTLTEEEHEEQLALRVEYLEAFRKNFREQLDSIEIVDEPQCNNKKNEGEKTMKKDGVNVGYDAAEELEIKTTGEATGENHTYENAELLEEKSEEKNKSFMADEGKED
ncbi:MAG: DUF896 domain-containing protein [Eubacteriaceae bacterium]